MQVVKEAAKAIAEKVRTDHGVQGEREAVAAGGGVGLPRLARSLDSCTHCLYPCPQAPRPPAIRRQAAETVSPAHATDPEKAAHAVMPMQQGGPQPGKEVQMVDKPIHIPDSYRGSGKLQGKVAIVTGKCVGACWRAVGLGASFAAPQSFAPPHNDGPPYALSVTRARRW
jgi:hypothetical protein